MVKLENAVIARYSHGGEHFELLVDPDLAMDVKQGKDVNLNDLLAVDRVFKDAKKGEEKAPESVRKVFGTENIMEVAKKIIREGEVHLTTEQRRRLVERRRKEVVAFISKNALNPQTNSPHPVQRIETAMEEAKVNIDIHKPFNEQVRTAVEAIKKLIPLSMERLKVAVKIPAAYAGKASVVIHTYDVKQEEWQRDGSLIAVFEIPAGLKAELFNKLNSLTHGSVETKIL